MKEKSEYIPLPWYASLLFGKKRDGDDGAGSQWSPGILAATNPPWCLASWVFAWTSRWLQNDPVDTWVCGGLVDNDIRTGLFRESCAVDIGAQKELPPSFSCCFWLSFAAVSLSENDLVTDLLLIAKLLSFSLRLYRGLRKTSTLVSLSSSFVDRLNPYRRSWYIYDGVGQWSSTTNMVVEGTTSHC